MRSSVYWLLAGIWTAVVVIGTFWFHDTQVAPYASEYVDPVFYETNFSHPPAPPIVPTHRRCRDVDDALVNLFALANGKSGCTIILHRTDEPYPLWLMGWEISGRGWKAYPEIIQCQSPGCNAVESMYPQYVIHERKPLHNNRRK